MIRKRYTEIFTFIYIVIFSIIYYLSFRFPYQIRFHTRIFFSPIEDADFSRYGIMAVGLLPFWLLCIRRLGFFLIEETDIKSNLLLGVLYSIVASGVLFSVASFLYRTNGFSRIVLILHFLFLSVLLFLATAGLRLLQRYLRSRGIGVRRLAFIGKNRLSEFILSRMRMKKLLAYEIVGYIVTDNDTNNNEILGTIDDLEKIISERNINEVLITLPEMSFEEWDNIVRRLGALLVYVSWVPEIFNVLAARTHSDLIGPYPFIHIKGTSLVGINLLLKRGLDIVLSIIGLIVLSPLLILIAVLLKITQGGDILYKQDRVGLFGKLFYMYKFTSMRPDAEKGTGPVWAKKDDDRVTPLGKILRRTSIDELPQIINILKGEMSIVGPRPERPNFVMEFSKEIPGYSLRHNVMPGLTGWAQVHELRGNTSIHERTIYDLYYITNADIFLDIRIIIRTALDFLFHKTAY